MGIYKRNNRTTNNKIIFNMKYLHIFSTCIFIFMMVFYLLPSLRMFVIAMNKVGIMTRILKNNNSKKYTFKIIPFEYVLLPLLVPSFYYSYLNAYIGFSIIKSIGFLVAIIPILYLSNILSVIIIMSIYNILRTPFRYYKLKKILYKRKFSSMRDKLDKPDQFL